MAVERLKRFHFSGREPKADVAIGTNQDHAARRDAGASGIDARVVRDFDELQPASAQPRERLGVGDSSKNEHAV